MAVAAAASRTPVSGPALAANTAAPTTSAQTRNDSRVGKDQIIDRERQARRQHADEMHGPDRDRERERGAGEQQPPPQSGAPPTWTARLRPT